MNKYSPEIKAAEKRIHPRKAWRTKIVFNDEFGDGLFYVYSEDVSMGGFFLASDIPVRTGSLLFLSFEIPPRKRAVRLTGEVVRRAGGISAKNSGIGIRFVGLPNEVREKLESFLDKEK